MTLSLNAFAASGEEATDTVETPSAIIKWDTSGQTMTNVEAKQAAVLLEQIRGQLEERFLASGRLTTTEDMKVETTETGLKKLKATVDMMNFAVVRVGEEGQLVHSCSDTPEVVQEATQSSQPAQEEK